MEINGIIINEQDIKNVRLEGEKVVIKTSVNTYLFQNLSDKDKKYLTKEYKLKFPKEKVESIFTENFEEKPIFNENSEI